MRHLLRGLTRYPKITMINILGLSCALSVSLTIFFYATDELSVDNEFNLSNRIFRLVYTDQNSRQVHFPSYYKDKLALDLNGMAEHVTRVLAEDELVQYKEKKFHEKKFLYADKEFFRLFSYRFIHGNSENALSRPNEVVITNSTANKYFADENPIGKTLRINDKKDYVITGVIDELEFNSHLDFGFIGSFSSIENLPYIKNGNLSTVMLYALARSNTLLDDILKGLNNKKGEYFKKTLDISNVMFDLQSLPDIYFCKDQIQDDIAKLGDKKSVYIFITVGILIILMASCNFVNLNVVQTMHRMKSVGIRKLLGSTKSKLLLDHLSETTVLVFISLLLALIFANSLLTYINQNYNINIYVTLSEKVITLCALVAGVVILLCGLYPAIIFSNIDIQKAVKGQYHLSEKSKTFSKSLLISQFSIAIVLVTMSILIYRQLSFIHEKSLGFQKENVLTFHSNNRGIFQNAGTIKNRITAHSGVNGVTLINGGLPGENQSLYTISMKGHRDNFKWCLAAVDYDYMNVLSLKLSEGRFFSQSFPYDEKFAVVINEAAVRQLGLTEMDVIGKEVIIDGMDSVQSRFVIGVLEDFHYASMRNRIEPLILVYDSEEWGQTFMVKMASNSIFSSIDYIHSVWKEFAPEYPFEYSFLDETINSLYIKNQRQFSIMTIFSIISILIAVLGIYGLLEFSLKRRSKEFAVRRVLGASINQIIIEATTELRILLLIALMISIPISFLLGNQWLSDFAYRINIKPIIFIESSFIVVLALAIVIIFQSIGSARKDVLQELKTE